VRRAEWIGADKTGKEKSRRIIKVK